MEEKIALFFKGGIVIITICTVSEEKTDRTNKKEGT